MLAFLYYFALHLYLYSGSMASFSRLAKKSALLVVMAFLAPSPFLLRFFSFILISFNLRLPRPEVPGAAVWNMGTAFSSSPHFTT